MKTETKKKLSVTEELSLIAERHDGVLSEVDTERYARKENTALHSLFTWDDTKAGYKYRLIEAASIIRARYEKLPSPDDPAKMISVRSWPHLSSENGGHSYRPIRDVLGKAALRKVLVADAKREALSFRNKYAALAELAEVRRAIDKFLK